MCSLGVLCCVCGVPGLLGEFFAVCQESHTILKPENCEFMHETMQYLGFNIGYGWWTPAASNAKLLTDAKVQYDMQTPRKDSMMYAVSLGLATSTAATSTISPTPAPS